MLRNYSGSYKIQLILLENLQKVLLFQYIQGGKTPTSRANIAYLIPKDAHLAKQLTFLCVMILVNWF